MGNFVPNIEHACNVTSDPTMVDCMNTNRWSRCDV